MQQRADIAAARREAEATAEALGLTRTTRLVNALEIQQKKIADARIVCLGAGAAGIGLFGGNRLGGEQADGALGFAFGDLVARGAQLAGGAAQNARSRETAIDVVKVQPGQGL